MEVKVKLCLPDAATHQQLSNALAPHHLRTHLQENLFFDSAADPLTAHLAILHLRFYNGDSRCILSLKACPHVAGGVSRVEEDKEIDPSLGRTYAAEPWRLAALASSSPNHGKDQGRVQVRQRNSSRVGEAMVGGGGGEQGRNRWGRGGEQGRRSTQQGRGGGWRAGEKEDSTGERRGAGESPTNVGKK